MGVPLLTTLESARLYMQKLGIDVLQDPDLEALNIQASDAIPRFCSREFGSTLATTRSFEYRPEQRHHQHGDTIDTSPYELRNLLKITFDPEEAGGGTVLASGLYRLWPYPATREGTYLGVRLAPRHLLPILPEVASRFPTRRVDIEGDWGMTKVPDAIQRLANITIGEWARALPRNSASGFNQAHEEAEPPGVAEDLPAAVRLALKRGNWMRPVFPR